MRVENKEAHKYRPWQYVLFFFAYAFIGYLYETVLEVVIYRWGFSNRGVLFGPYLPVYGVGALAFLFLWYRLIRDKSGKNKLLMVPIIFILTMLTATLIELLTSYILEWTMGSWPWQTYAAYPLNFQARIALNPSIRFGLGGVIFLYLVQPFLDRVSYKIGDRAGKRISMLILSTMVLDLIFSFGLK